MKRLLEDPALRFASLVYFLLRLVISALAGMIWVLYPGDLAPDPILRPYLGVASVEGGLFGLTLGVWQRWDTLWYMLIAREGYGLSDTRIFAPPLYPLLMRLFGSIGGGDDRALLLGGLVVSNLACIALFAYLYRLVEMEWDTALARRTVVYTALFPTAFFLLAAYAESLFLLCAVAAFYHARRGQWIAASVWGFFAPLVRLPGVVILIPLGWEFARQWCDSRRSLNRLRWWHGSPLLLIALGALLFPLYAHLWLGAESLLAPFAVHTERFMGRFAMPWESVWQAARVLHSGSFRVVEPFDLAFALLFAGLTVLSFWRLPTTYALYMACTLAGTLTKVGEIQPLLSLSRYVLVLFPGFVLLAQVGQRGPWSNRMIVYPLSALLVFFVGQFAIWGWVG